MEQLANKQAKKKTGVKRRRKSSDEGDEREIIGSAPPVPVPGSRQTRNGLEDYQNQTVLIQDSGVVEQPSPPRPLSQPANEALPISRTLSDTASGSSKQANLLRYLFAPEPVLDLRYGYNDTASIQLCDTGQSDLWEEMGGDVWTEESSSAHLNMDQDAINEYVLFISTHNPNQVVLMC